MASSQDTVSMALFCDFENVALGVRDAKYEKFDIKLVLERLLLKGSIVVKKAYCDWDRYKGFKAAMHEANFELIEIPHVRQSGKNSADIRLVVDALDLCYTKSHVNTFVIISGDSDFSPLVSKLRENAKQVIGVGVQRSTSDLLTANCDEFIFYDDLVRENQRAAAKRDSAKAAQQAAQQATKRASDGEKRKEDLETRKTKAIELAVQTFDALASERGDSGKIWASVLKNAIKRRKPDFNETYYGFRAFGNLLEEAQSRGLLEVGRDEKSGTFVYRSASSGAAAPAEIASPRESADEWAAMPAAAEIVDFEEAAVTASVEELVPADEAIEAVPPAHADNGKSDTRRKGRGTRKPAAKRARKKTDHAEAADGATDAPPAADTQHVAEPVAASAAHAPGPEAEHPATEAPAAKKKPSRKSTARSRRPRKTESANDAE
ncbi:NYN domain-containing protein [Paraburkholderia caribensis]|uniref:NYN domain-containing protein n=1 Tax=Paraburkholderia caribensis TaxID=75105 RepID=A0A9Q6WKL8_9BURK|nr:NYN domain-containing protein [Paraburkholderia caribensis]MCO4882786.1 NYN domain-containing protein [Paraburkholderia caribensis]PTB24802.1 NYN domain-containing protein [Paraburkholderia caribensis]QLB61968.1 NYN domain-containing protein [Paraburkholderia caribensis]